MVPNPSKVQWSWHTRGFAQTNPRWNSHSQRRKCWIRTNQKNTFRRSFQGSTTTTLNSTRKLQRIEQFLLEYDQTFARRRLDTVVSTELKIKLTPKREACLQSKLANPNIHESWDLGQPRTDGTVSWNQHLAFQQKALSSSRPGGTQR